MLTDSGTVNRTVVLPGGNGFLGRILQRFLVAEGLDVVVLSRTETGRRGNVTFEWWDGRTLGPWQARIDGSRAVVNLAGRSVNCRYHRRNRRDILSSRVDSTRILGEAIARCNSPPPVWLNSSTATIYKHSLDRPMDEANGLIGATPAAKDAFSVDVAVAWERALDEAATPQTRKVALRTAMVLAAGRGGVFDVLHRLVRFRLGGTMAGGDQYVSWIHADDFCRAVKFLLDRPELDGPVNLASPCPVPNREMMQTFREVCNVRLGLPATRWMLEAGAFVLRTETELIIKSRRVIPSRLQAAGFQFEFPELREALANILGKLSVA